MKHSFREITRRVEGCHAHVDVDQQLVECRSNGCEEALPDVDSGGKGVNILAGGEEVAISTDSDGTHASWVLLNDEVEGGNERGNVGVAVGWVARLVTVRQDELGDPSCLRQRRKTAYFVRIDMSSWRVKTMEMV